MPVQFRGRSFPFVPQDKLTPGEIDAVERVTDLTFQRIRRMGEVCVCGHGARAHTHKDAAGEVDPSDTSCGDCDCDRHESDLPTRISTAFMWVSIKRGDPTVRYADVSDTPLTELQIEADEVRETDPTVSPELTGDVSL